LSKKLPSISAGAPLRRVFATLLGKGKANTREWYELLLSLFAIVTVLAFGTYGYHLLEGWSLFDSLYMTTITLSTVGFMEVHPMSQAGRAFTIGLIFVGVGVAMGLLTLAARIVIEHQITWIFERGNMQQHIDKLREHTIFCGYGRLSRFAIEKLVEGNMPIVVIDKNEEKINDAIADGHLAIHGDAAMDEVLLQAGVDRANRLVSLLATDSDNLYVILTSKELNPSLFILSRSEDELGERRLKRAGADRIISPYRVGGSKIAEGLMRPHVTEFLDIAASSGAGELEIEEILIPNDSPVQGMTLKGSNIRQKTNIIVAAIIPPSGKMVFNPSGETLIESGSTLIGMGLRSDFRELERLLLGEHKQRS